MLRGSYANGFAPRDGMARFPSLWRGCVGAWHPGLGPAGTVCRGNDHRKQDMEIAGAYYEAGGLFFDGVDDFAEYAGAVVSSMPLTLCAWIKATQVVSAGTVLSISKSDATNHYWSLKTGSTVSAESRAGALAAASSTIASGTVNQWNHIAAVFVSATERYAVLNGKFATVNGISRSPAGVDRTSLSITYGAIASQYFSGHITDARVYNRALTQSELSILALRPGIAYEMRTERYAGESIAAFNRRRRLLTGVA